MTGEINLPQKPTLAEVFKEILEDFLNIEIKKVTSYKNDYEDKWVIVYYQKKVTGEVIRQFLSIDLVDRCFDDACPVWVGRDKTEAENQWFMLKKMRTNEQN